MYCPIIGQYDRARAHEESVVDERGLSLFIIRPDVSPEVTPQSELCGPVLLRKRHKGYKCVDGIRGKMNPGLPLVHIGEVEVGIGSEEETSVAVPVLFHMARGTSSTLCRQCVDRMR